MSEPAKTPTAAAPAPAVAEEDDEYVRISVIEDPADFTGAFEVCARAFGEQIHDAVWIALSPGWDTAAGRAAGAARMADRFRRVTRDDEGRPNTVFLKATVARGPDAGRVVGTAVWAQLSAVPGKGDPPSAELGGGGDEEGKEEDGEEGKGKEGGQEGTEEERRRARELARQVWASLMARRVAAVRAKAETPSPAAFVLDLCAVDPAAQRRGVASRLVRWGLEEAARRGGLEATTEASVMGRHVYRKLGFRPVAEVAYEVDEELLEGRVLPSNLFMRTGDVD